MIYTHPVCIDHFAGFGHPESPERLRAVLQALEAEEFARVPRIEAPLASREQIERAHAAELVTMLFENAPAEGLFDIDSDTSISPASVPAALRAAGGACAAVDAMLSGETKRAFCAVRPPGHHATPDTAMGFCLFNTVAIAAHHALAAHGLQRVAIVDFDVHHGNGSQDIFWREPRVLYASSHESPLYPGTGRMDERGAGNIVNAPLPPGSGSEEFREVYELLVLPALDVFKPQLVIISAGFDAHRLDPLANLNLGDDDYGWVTEQLVAVADRHAGGRVLSCLEGGYSLTALRGGVTAHCRALFNVIRRPE